MPTTATPPPDNDLALIEALCRNATLTADEAARYAGVPVPAVATDDDPGGEPQEP